MKSDDKYTLIGSRIKAAREAEHLSQKDLAEKLGYESATAISLIEAGARKVSVEDLERISQELHRDIKFFLGQQTVISPIRVALRAEGKLDKTDEDQIVKFIEFVKSQK